MPTYYVKLKDTEQPIEVKGDDNPDQGGYIGPHYDGTLVLKRGDHEVAHFLRANVVAWWREDDASEASSLV